MTSISTLMAALHGDDPQLRQRAALELGRVDTSAQMHELVELMASEPDDFVRETLVWAVVSRPSAATRELVAALDRDDLPHEPVLHALSKIGDGTTHEAIAVFAADDDPMVRSKAWWALARIPSEAGLALLIGQLGQVDAALRHGLTRALLQFGGGAIGALGKALESDAAAVRSHAAEVLVAFADPTRYGTIERRTGGDFSSEATEVLRSASAPEVDGALLMATISDDHPGIAKAAQRLRDERA